MSIITRYFSTGLATSGSLSLVYTTGANTIVRGAGSFVTDGFQIGDTVRVTGTASNNGTYTLANVAALTLTTNEALANETVTSRVTFGDGTTWNKRTNLLDSGVFTPAITSFNFAGSDSMVALVGPGTYTVTTLLQASSFTNAPTAANPLLFNGCDSSGVILASPDPDWTADMLPFDDTTFPVVATTTNIATTNLAQCSWRLIKFTASGRTGGSIISGGANTTLDWVSFVNTTSNTGAQGVTGVTRMTNSMINMSGASFDTGLVIGSALTSDNIKIYGPGAGTSGNRRAIAISGAIEAVIERFCCYNVGGEGIIITSSSTSQRMYLSKGIVANVGTTGIKTNNTAAQTVVSLIDHVIVTGCATAGLDAQSAGRVLVVDSRFRDNPSGASGITGLGNYPTDWGIYTIDSDDATEYADAANGDFRIRPTAAIAPYGFGISVQPGGIGGTFSTKQSINRAGMY